MPLPKALAAVRARLLVLQKSDGVLDRVDPSQRVLVRDVVQAIVEPHVLDWMEDDDVYNGAEIIPRALREINQRFEDE